MTPPEISLNDCPRKANNNSCIFIFIATMNKLQISRDKVREELRFNQSHTIYELLDNALAP